MFDESLAGAAAVSGGQGLAAWARVENASCARRLAGMVAMLEAAYAASGSAVRDQWALDNYAAVATHIGAVLCQTSGVASAQLLIAVGLHERLPKVAALFAEGLIDYRLVRMMVLRSGLVIDPEAQRALDEALARALVSWGPMSVDRAAQAIDALVAEVDPQALHRTQTKARGRCVDVVVEDGSGLAQLFCTLFVTDAQALDERADALAATVCPADPRTKDQRRADAVGALARGADRLVCLCDTEDCPAGDLAPSSGVVVYVVAHQDTIDGPADEPAAPDVSPTPDDTPVPDAPPSDGARTPDGADDPDDTETEAAGGAHGSYDRDPCTDECAGLDGLPPPMFAKPLHELTLTEILAPAPGMPSTIRAGVMMGGQFVPGSVTRRAALNATFVAILHPGQAPPEARYRPSKKLADFVRCRDLTCRFPGCKQPATHCEIDHMIAWPCGPTQASNLKCLCPTHHLLKTFWGGEEGWRDQELEDGTVVWTAPDGRTHTTTPGSRQLFPELSTPTAPAHARGAPVAHTAGLTMPRRKTTRADDRLHRITCERELNEAEAEAEAEAEPPPPS